MYMNKVRFNLGRGENYMKWKVTYVNGDVVYYNPEEVQLVMEGCVFKNNDKIAQKIFDGSNKSVCAWVLCKDIKVTSEIKHTDITYQVSYNPRVQPHWVLGDEVIDNCEYPRLHTLNKKIFITT